MEEIIEPTSCSCSENSCRWDNSHKTPCSELGNRNDPTNSSYCDDHDEHLSMFLTRIFLFHVWTRAMEEERWAAKDFNTNPVWQLCLVVTMCMFTHCYGFPAFQLNRSKIFIGRYFLSLLFIPPAPSQQDGWIHPEEEPLSPSFPVDLLPIHNLTNIPMVSIHSGTSIQHLSVAQKACCLPESSYV